MMSKFSKSLFFLLFIFILISEPKQALANIPDATGYVYYTNPDGTRTNRGVANIWVKWTDTDPKFPQNAVRYAKTDINGKYVFKLLVDYTLNGDGDGGEDIWRREYNRQRSTWIKPDQPEIAPIEGGNHVAEGYVRLYGDNEEANFGCTKNPQTFSVVQPKDWHGRFVSAQATDNRPEHVVNASTLGGFDFGNGTRESASVNVGDFYYLPSIIAGQVVDQDNKPIQGVTVNVYNAQAIQQSRPYVTDADGRYQISEFIGKDEIYAVRIDNPPLGFTPKTTTNDWTWRFVNPLDKNDPRNGNTSLDSSSYEVQKYGDDDCAGPALSGSEAGKRGRCNFKLNPAPIASENPNPSVTPDPNTSPRPTGSSNPFGSNPPLSSPYPSGVTPACLSLPATGSVSSVTIDNNALALNNATSLALSLRGFSGQSNYIVPVVINYSNNACRVLNMKFRYNPQFSSPRPTPNPSDCAKVNGRPDDCACTENRQCSGGTCNINRGNVCSTQPFIKTQGGDVHSNTRIEQ